MAEWCGAVVERVMQDYSKYRIHVARKLNSPEQFRPFPVYPGLHSHTCDPRVFVQVEFK